MDSKWSVASWETWLLFHHMVIICHWSQPRVALIIQNGRLKRFTTGENCNLEKKSIANHEWIKEISKRHFTNCNQVIFYRLVFPLIICDLGRAFAELFMFFIRRQLMLSFVCGFEKIICFCHQRIHIYEAARQIQFQPGRIARLRFYYPMTNRILII